MTASMPPHDTPTTDAAYDVVVVGASAGGLPALRQLVLGLGQDFALPVVAMLHLPPGADAESVLLHLKLRVQRLQGGQRIGPGTVWMCPPRAYVDLLPDGTAVVTDNPQGTLGKPIDRLLDSTARSFGPRAIGVVLSGMGNDGAAGASALRAAGGRVLVQSPESCEHADMPTAAIQAGATDLVVPLAELGDVLGELAQGAPSARTRAELRAIGAAFGDQGDVALVARERDWQATSLGPVLAWPEPLRALVREGVDSPHAVALWWGRDQTEVYNEAWSVFLGARHPGALGRPARLNWDSDWERIDPLVEQVLNQSRPVGHLGLTMQVRRGGATEEVFANLSLAPLRDATGGVAGIRALLWETTFDVVAQRRMRLLHELATRLAGAATRHEACHATAAAFETDSATVPFGLVYLVEPRGLQATLASAAGLQPGSPAAPHLLHLASTNAAAWPLARVVGEPGSASAAPILLDLTDGRLPELARLLADAPGGLRASHVMLAPLRAKPADASPGVLVLGLAPQRPYDGAHSRFVETMVQQVAAGLGYARAKELERERSDRLATLDRAKTEFFANVSHEFRTPLTLLLAPLEALARARDTLPAPVGAELDVAVRSARRLLRMVNSLLDFSQIDVRGRKAPVAQTDLGLLTMDIASAFRSAIEAAGLALQVDIAPGLPAVPVNSGMWEQIVSNLLANAFKFTFEGTIAVRLKALRLHAELEVSDTGIGIPSGELQNIFKRFHRVRGARARTSEGAGIGLALVHDLTHRMGGQLTLRSVEGQGSTFTVWLPLRAQPLRTEVVEEEEPPAQPLLASDLASEAARWLSGPDTALPDVAQDLLEPPVAGVLPGARSRLLVVDDNADMREYLQRLLADRWNVQLAADGARALALARAQPPDLVLTDVMMPNLDGFALLRAIRQDESLKNTPVIFLTARAGEDTAVEGLLAGADDYVAKPFSARELVARVGGQIELSRARRRTQELNEFLVRFSDAVRGLTNPRAVGDTACRMLLEQLGVDRAHWGEIDWTTEEFVIIGSVHAPGVAPLEGRFPLAAWAQYSDSHRHGRAMVVEDTQADPRADSAMREATARMGIGADLAAPVLTGGRLTCVLGVNQRLPRGWTSQEIALVQSVAGRCWAEVERARAEMALRAKEEKYRSLFETMGQGYAELEIIRGPDGNATDIRYIEVNPQYERLSGIPAAEARGRTVLELIPDAADWWIPEYDRIVRSGRPAHIENEVAAFGKWYEVDVYPRGGDRFSILFEEITVRKRAEIALREREERKTFLLKLSDALRAEPDKDAVANRAIRMLFEHMRLDRCYIAYYRLADDAADFPYQYGNETVPPLPAQVRLSDFPNAFEQVREATFVVDDDFERRGLSEEERASSKALGMRAMLASTLRRGAGNPVCSMMAVSSRPRHWSPDEIALVEEAAERTWAAVERARAESELRRADERYRAMTDNAPVLIWETDASGLVFSNRHYTDFFGLPLETVRGMGWASFLHSLGG